MTAATPDEIRQLVESAGGALTTRPDVLSKALDVGREDIASLLDAAKMLIEPRGTDELLLRRTSIHHPARSNDRGRDQSVEDTCPDRAQAAFASERSRGTGTPPVADVPVELPVRAYNVLMRAGIRTLGMLTDRTDDELLAAPYLGRGALANIREAVSRYRSTPHTGEDRSQQDDALPAAHDDSDRGRPTSAPNHPEFGRREAARAAALMERLGLEHAGEHVQAKARNYEEAFTLAAVADEPLSQLDRIAVEAVHLAGARDIVVADLRTEHTLAEVGHMFRLTRARIGQIEEQVLGTLREQGLPEPEFKTLVQRLRNGVAADDEVLAELGGGQSWHATNFCAVLMRSLGLERPEGFEGRIKGYWTAAPECVVRTLRVAAADLPLTEGELVERLASLQLPPDFPLEALVAQRGSPVRLHPVLTAWVRPTSSQRDAAWLLLRKHGEPVALDALAELLRMKKPALAESLRRDDRFVKRQPLGWWGLAEWATPANSEGLMA
jgi:hypothetical protein